jgi:diadenosine tetraphosphatase ApaH/serine/threonine PP2A family protein phosphatase
VNPGSVGLPFDGDPRAAWATWDGTGFELRRTAYDVERAADAFRRHGGELGEVFARQATRAARD